MKRLEIESIGINHRLCMSEVETPIPKAGELLIKTKAFSINPVDVKTRNGGGIYGRLKNDAPIVLGWDIAGEVVEVGPNVKSFKLGDRVFGMINFPGHGKTYAEYAIAPQEHIALIPANSNYKEAAATTLAALTAYQILKRHIKENDRVFIQSAAGGVGHFAVQIAKLMGAYVIGTASKKNEVYLNLIGIDRFVDYTKEKFEKVVEEVDFALDTMGAEILERTIPIVKTGGKIISIPTAIATTTKAKALKRNITVDFELVKSNGKDMQQLANWLAEEKIKPYIFKTYTFAQLEEAHKQMLTGTTRGKLIVHLQ